MAPEGIGSCQALIFLLEHLSQELGFLARMENRRFLHQEKDILQGLIQLIAAYPYPERMYSLPELQDTANDTS